jgi:hypothetical protein
MTNKLTTLFHGLQRQMEVRLDVDRAIIEHPGAKGTASELNWIDLFRSYLPRRYEANKAFVIDCLGSQSEEQDVVVHDRQYSPFIFNQDGAIYVPAESVYAVLEVKQEASKPMFEYAGKKVRSVRDLIRTSGEIPTASGMLPPKVQFPILAGFLALGSAWNPPFSPAFTKVLQSLWNSPDQLDIGLVIRHGSFETSQSQDGSMALTTSAQDLGLVSFFFAFLRRLQAVATVPAIDLAEYGRYIR